MSNNFITIANGVELFYKDINVPYKKIRTVEAETPVDEHFGFHMMGDIIDPSNITIEKVNFKLAQLAQAVGANAVINIEYRRDIGFTSLNAVFAKGIAVYKLSDEIPCPVCAETIKRAAKKCRFCNAEIKETSCEQELQNVDLPEYVPDTLQSDNAASAWSNVGCLAVLCVLVFALVLVLAKCSA